jgi:hypothetical protein
LDPSNLALSISKSISGCPVCAAGAVAKIIGFVGQIQIFLIPYICMIRCLKSLVFSYGLLLAGFCQSFFLFAIVKRIVFLSS